jgi:hypothetical protein
VRRLSARLLCFVSERFFSRQRSVPVTRNPVQRLLRSPPSLRNNHLTTPTHTILGVMMVIIPTLEIIMMVEVDRYHYN